MGLFSSRSRDEPRRQGRIVTIPAGGKAIVVSDLHGHFGDWDGFLRQSRVFERIETGEDLWLLITGDVPDLVRHRALDPDVPEEGDVRILDALIAAKERLGAKASRIVYLEGNHDFHMLRIAREVGLFEAGVKKTKSPPPEKWDEPIEPTVLGDYFEWYRSSFGDEVFENNITPYDMIHRAKPRHLQYLSEGPIMAVLEGAGVVVTHAGPPKMQGRSERTLKKAIEKATREELRVATPDDYYASPYHQLLNGRFRGGDYSLDDIEKFLAMFDARVLITGHTPHAYLVDAAKGTALEGCAFRDGMGLIGKRQVVLCTSFGAFDPSRKRWIELDLSRRYESTADLKDGVDIRRVHPQAPLPPDKDETTTIIKAISRQVLEEERQRRLAAQRPTRTYDPRAITSGD